jgi:hypothetical protein
MFLPSCDFLVAMLIAPFDPGIFWRSGRVVWDIMIFFVKVTVIANHEEA